MDAAPFFIFAIIKLLFVIVLIATPALLLILLLLNSKKNNSRNQVIAGPQKEAVERKEVIKEKGAHFDEERKRILTMVDNGKISAEEASRLLNALERETTTMDCLFCGGEIRIQAKKCKHCGKFFKDPFAFQSRRLTKSRDQVFCGVCGGIAEYLNLDPLLIRILSVVAALSTALITALVIYLIAALIIPDPES